MAEGRRIWLVGSVGVLLGVAGCVNRPPTLNCSADRSTVTEGDSVTIESNAVDTDRNERLTYDWQASEGNLTAKNGSAMFDSSGLRAGTYQVDLEVRDKKQQAATCSVDLTVEKRKVAPTIACNPGQVRVTEGKSKQLAASASDANQDALTYAWAVDGKGVENNQPSFEFGTTGRKVGSHGVRVTVTDVDGLKASCEFAVTVERRPNRNPSVKLSLAKGSVYAGETVMAKAEASDPDGDPLTYAWTLGGSSQAGSSAQVTLQTRGLSGGRHSVGVSVRDDRGGSGSATASLSVREKIVIGMPGHRLDNVAKAQLDEIALKMQQNAQLQASLTGHTDSRGSEAGNERMGLKRAEAVKKYLVTEQQINEGRIATASAGESQPIADNKTSEGRKENRRVEAELFVP